MDVYAQMEQSNVRIFMSWFYKFYDICYIL